VDSRIRIVPAQSKHIGRIARLMRSIDARECGAMGRTPKDALRNAFLTSSKAWTALMDDQPEAMFGVVVESVLDQRGVPWFLGTDEVYRHGRELLMYGPGIIERLCDSRRHLANLVSAENTRAIRLLRRWGFTVHEEAVDVRGVPFLHFEKAA
jgi:ribosomal protein S18 acetylase RimI-like enzyme